MVRKYFIETFGCQMNALDSEKIAGNLNAHGMLAAEDISDADLIILNTCSVRDKAVQKVYARLGEIKRFKKQSKDLLVGVAGCMAQIEAENILKRVPYVDILAGPQKGYMMHSLVERRIQTGTPCMDLRSDETPAPLENNSIIRRNPWRASVTISEGCDQRCTYCVVPATRGTERVRSSRNILNEVKELAARGYIEIMLLGQTVNSYIDREGGNVTFAELLRRISQISGIKRIRFTSPYPSDFTDELLEVMNSYSKICNHVHLPVQSGSTRVLKAMNRGYTREGYLDIIRRIKDSRRLFAISTDLIVGFPGEEEEDFEQTMTLLDEVQFDGAFSFKYSPRPNTEALKLPGSVPETEKSRRLHILQERQKEIQLVRNSAFEGKTVTVLVDGKARSRVSLTGRTAENKIVNFDGPENLIGQFSRAEITGYSANSLKGTWIPGDALE